MNKKNIDVTNISKLNYESPKIDSKKIELEYGIASGSNAPQQKWKDSQTINEDVENNFW